MTEPTVCTWRTWMVDSQMGLMRVPGQPCKHLYHCGSWSQPIWSATGCQLRITIFLATGRCCFDKREPVASVASLAQASLLGSTGSLSVHTFPVAADSFCLLPHSLRCPPALWCIKAGQSCPFDFCWGIWDNELLHNEFRYLTLFICWEVLREAFCLGPVGTEHGS
jgi:hypothetical protein